MSNLSTAAFKAWKRVEVSTDDSLIQAAIDSAEESLAQHCGRQFSLAGAASARLFRATSDRSTVIDIDDCTTVTLVTDSGNTIDASAYQLEPVNGLQSWGEQTPYTAIRLIQPGYWSRFYGQATVSVTATWGWPQLPARYFEAVKILTADILDNRDIRNGVLGFTDFAGIRVRENPVVSALVAKLVRAHAFGIA
jgi:hypothetical protein